MKFKVGVMFGGKSIEHDYSVLNALWLMDILEKNGYKPVPLYLNNEGFLYCDKSLNDLSVYQNIDKHLNKISPITIIKKGNQYLLKRTRLFTYTVAKIELVFCLLAQNSDFILVRGLLERLHIPYTGIDINSSSICYDAVLLRNNLVGLKIPVKNWLWFNSSDISDNYSDIHQKVKKLGYPVVVKPAHLTMDLVYRKIENETELMEGIVFVTQFDNCVLIEKELANYHEFSIAVTNNGKVVKLSKIAESFQYQNTIEYDLQLQPLVVTINKGQDTNFDVPLSDELKEKIEFYALKIVKQFNLQGVIKINFIFDETKKHLTVSSVDTTSLQMIAKMFEQTEVDNQYLIDTLLSSAKNREKERKEITETIKTNILEA